MKTRSVSSGLFLNQLSIIFFVLFSMTFSSPLFAAEGGRVSDAVNAFIYNPNNPEAIQPLYIGDAIPEDAVIYLPDPNSKITFDKGGKSVVVDKPGFYNSSGAPVQVSEQTRALINGRVQAQAKTEAENIFENAESGVAEIQVDDPQKVPSPS